MNPSDATTRRGDERRDWVVCLGGEDWWYHTHAHFDIQVMKRLAHRCRVLYVCSTGMRMPSLSRDAMFWTRIRSKLVSFTKALRRVREGFYVYSPLTVPAYHYPQCRAINRALLAGQFALVFSRLDIQRPLFWVNTPTTWPAATRFARRGVVYQRTDDYAEYDFDNLDADYVRGLDRGLLASADLVLHVSEELHASASKVTRSAMLLEQGVDERFLERPAPMRVPLDLADVPRPVVGYVGTMESYKFDAALVGSAAKALPDHSFVLVGPPHATAGSLRALSNVHFLGAKTHDEIPDYVRAFDVCMLPTARTEWGMRARPLKLMEYLMAGRPVIATRTPASQDFADVLTIADEPEQWARLIPQLMIPSPQRTEAGLTRVRDCSWARQVERIWEALRVRGLT